MDDEKKTVDYFRMRRQTRRSPDALKIIGILLSLPIFCVGLLLVFCGIFGIRETTRLYSARERPVEVVFGCVLVAIGVAVTALMARWCWIAALPKQGDHTND